MDSVVDISFWQLALFSLTLLIPVSINHYYQLSLGRDIVIGVLRMTIQLLAVGVYLEYLFQLNSLWVNMLWLVLMIGIGSSSIISKAKLTKPYLFLPVTLGLTVSLVPLLILICVVVVKPTPLYNAQYLIPLAGMLLGNCLSGNIVALQNLFTAYDERKHEYEAAISLGATPIYASIPFMRAAMQKSFAPILATMITTGLVTLPGMMTGQILGGASPMVAIKYQLLIMIAIFVMMSVSITLSLRLTIARAISQEGRILVTRIDKS
ncbi:ABC transporter permease [Vibrio sp. SCSIO 43135]|uniref:ABC transporter permease n=1 Tax=Vibrio sp. SCSIO 43135 TaxID=2819096 RepID=UPI0020759CE2|nr:ABC transporter permease [Vibrio sp. SCSIO 43135]USD40175.1 ABC transporter permease [Vibrio sp. SCSIO 43135]